MQRKQFNAIAAAFSSALASIPYTPEDPRCEDQTRDTLETLAEEIANVCAEANPLFQRSRFLTACGL